MTLHYKPGQVAPQLLPPEDVDGDGYIWTDLANNEHGRQLCGWVEAPPPPAFDPAAERLVPTVDGWAVEAIPPAVLGPVRIGKFWLFERFTEDQERRFAVLEYQARNLTPADLADPTKEGLFQLQRFLRRLDALTVVELDAPGTLAGFGLLRLLGVFGDPATVASSTAMAEALRPPEGREWEAAA